MPSFQFDSDKGFLRHNVVEVVWGNCRITVRVCPVDHLLQLLVSHGLTELASYTAQVTNGDSACAIIIEESEDLVDIFTGVSVTHTSSHHVEELFKVDVIVLVLVKISDHLVDSLVLSFEAQRLHSGAELTWVDRAATIRVEKIESFFDLLNFVFCETGTKVLVCLELGSASSHFVII